MSDGAQKQVRLEKLAGLALIAATVLALALANSPFGAAYQQLVHWHIGPTLPRLGEMTLHLWVADGLMAIFFLLVGLEVKREWYEGRLAGPEARRLPIIAAMVPATAAAPPSMTPFSPSL